MTKAEIGKRLYKIDGYAVSEKELLEQAGILRGNIVRSVGLAARIIREDGRDVEFMTPKGETHD